MEIDVSTVAAALSEGANVVRLAKRYDLAAKYLRGDIARKAWVLVEQHVETYQEVPTLELIQKHVADFRIPETPLEPFDFYIAELRYRVRQDSWMSLGPKLGPLVVKGELDAARKAAREFLIGDEALLLENKQYVQSIFTLTDALKERYERIEAGKIGVPYPWPTMNSVTLGSDPGDFNGFLGRLGMGKTQCLLLCAHHAWKEANTKVLFVSPEMKRIQLAQRMFSYHLRLPQGQVRRARLESVIKQKYFEELDELAKLDGFYIIADEFRISIDLIEAAIDQIRPDAVYVDGAYLVLAETGLSRQENAERVADELPALAKRKGVPMNFSTQLNRTAMRNDPETFTDTSIGLTDAFGQNSSNLFMVIQTDDMKADRELTLKQIKAREDRGDAEIRIAWNWETNDFKELGTSDSTTFQDTDYSKYGEPGAPTAAAGGETASSEEFEEIPF